MKVKIYAKDSTVVLPKYATSGSSGVDLVANENFILYPADRALIGTGLFLEIPEGYEGQVRPRSGLAINYGITIPNSPGTLDFSYRGEVKVILYNTGEDPFVIEAGKTRIAQLVFAPITLVEWEQVSSVEELSSTDRGSGGFGHTGINVK